MQKKWDSVKGKIDDQRFEHVRSLLKIQEKRSRLVEKCMCSLFPDIFKGINS